jgi:limonene-1,2-epoxide hydrolase
MRLRMTTLALATTMMLTTAACAPGPDEDDAVQAEDAVTSAQPSIGEKTVRAYYAAYRSPDVRGALDTVFHERAVVEAPSILILQGKSQIGKAAFIDSAVGVRDILANARLREVARHGDALFIARIDLPLPNGDVLTQIEYFEIVDGRIIKMQSYYDSLRFLKALPAVALDRVKQALGIR